MCTFFFSVVDVCAAAALGSVFDPCLRRHRRTSSTSVRGSQSWPDETSDTLRQSAVSTLCVQVKKVGYDVFEFRTARFKLVAFRQIAARLRKIQHCMVRLLKARRSCGGCCFSCGWICLFWRAMAAPRQIEQQETDLYDIPGVCSSSSSASSCVRRQEWTLHQSTQSSLARPIPFFQDTQHVGQSERLYSGWTECIDRITRWTHDGARQMRCTCNA